MIDLRSDTITRPTEGMLQAMMAAEVGDDVFREDPTVNRLEETLARLLGKEAALFVPSGTMANQIAIRTHTQHGDRVLMDASAHVYFYEAGAIAALSGVMPVLVPGNKGVFLPEHVQSQILPENDHFAPLKLVCFENTHNRGGGTVWKESQLKAVHDLCRERGLMMHMDGARLWNASVASGISMEVLAGYADSVSVCFSKGLGAPVGSAVAGTRDWIRKARRFRKQFGGGMRQAGYLAAAALYAIEHHRDRLAEDHVHAKKLAMGLADIKGVEIQPSEVETNILFFKTLEVEASKWVAQWEGRGIRMLATGPNTVRAVTHLMISSEDIDTVLCTLKQSVS